MNVASYSINEECEVLGEWKNLALSVASYSNNEGCVVLGEWGEKLALNVASQQ